MSAADRGLPVWSPRAARVVEREVHRRQVGGPASAAAPVVDQIVVEEPLEIRIGGDSLVVTMRTPGDDLDLAAGFLFTEGVIATPDDVATIAHTADDGPDAGNIVVVTPRADRPLRVADARRIIRATAACGLCGKENIAAVRRRIARLTSDARVSLRTLATLPDAVRAAQPVFDATGGLHAVGLFQLDGTLIVAKEDVGRHNAVDKVLGHQLLQGRRQFADTMMMVSGRAGFEIVQKAAVAGVPIVGAVSAPSSLAVDLARDVGMTLVGFVRGASANVYSHAFRVGA
ncbi:MAG TPA: formate dehydrogenase accessory sulfurtransferase FdhD [Polyangia bacterium]|nr:formate dehydrogenase accessory sulfurtransferase FdhD [Polyangia bacterium]